MARADAGKRKSARHRAEPTGATDALDVFSPETRAWFEGTFGAPTPAQELGWPAISTGEHVLIQAPTGSGKTLAAFLYGIDRLDKRPGDGLRLLYVSPLKALNYDVERNLRGPLAGLRSELRVAVRTGDTPQKDRAAFLKEPADILITTPESLFLLLTSRARETLRTVETLIVDEVHAVAGTKAELSYPAPADGQEMDAGTELGARSIWPSIYPALLELVRSHRSTIVFVNNRRLAERLAVRLNELAEDEMARAHHGSLAREQRLVIEEDLKAGRIPCLVATSSLELGIDMGAVDPVIQVE